jgi:hypothetical protein
MMPRLALLTTLALAACQAAPDPAAAPGPAPAAADTRAPGSFDGVYRGTWTVTLDLSGQCRAPVLNDTTLTIRGSEARLLNPELGTNGRGTVQPDGRFRVPVSAWGGPINFNGLVAQDSVAMVGMNRSCGFEVRMTRLP